MKKALYILLLLPMLSLGQSSAQNYVKSTVYKAATTSSTNTTAARNVEVTYYDGLGRKTQQIAGDAAPDQKDIITYFEYDEFGRERYKNLPYKGPGSSQLYDSSVLTNFANFYNTTEFENTQNPYEEHFYEKSPLNRVMKIAAPGEAWEGVEGSLADKTIKYEYLFNDSSDEPIKVLKAVADWSVLNLNEHYYVSFVDEGTYNPGDLYKVVTKNENWTAGLQNTTVEYTNKAGQLILKRVYGNWIPYEDTFMLEIHDTYYVYDQMGNLCYVLPPLSNGSNVNIDKLGYQYKYDGFHRLVEKKLPGKDWEFIVYDGRDRVVATGPALNPFGGTGKGWLYTYYDKYNRPAYTIWYPATVNSTTRDQLREQVNNLPWDIDDAVEQPCVARGSGTINSVNPVAMDYVPGSLPSGATTSNIILLSVNYYDDYDFLSITLPSTVYGVATRTASNNLPVGLPTGTWTRALTASTEGYGITTYTLYDFNRRPIYVNTMNSYLQSETRVESKLDFIGKVEETKTIHKKTGKPDLTIYDIFTYDHAERLLTHHQRINTTTQLIAYNKYDDLGRLKNKKVGEEESTSTTYNLTGSLQTVTYGYNVRGWLTSINNQAGTNSAITLSDNAIWGFQINYDNPSNSSYSLYNGNISQTLWKSTSANPAPAGTICPSYLYEYDALNRLTKAVDPPLKYGETISYDKNGNITKLKRVGQTGTDPGTGTPLYGNMDDLTYTYDGNRLTNVTDAASLTTGFTKDVPNGGTATYTYDAYGNLLKDYNKSIGITAGQEIVYNHLHLPVKLYTPSGTITYVYDAAGTKLKKTVNPGTAVVTEYDGGFTYEKIGAGTNSLQFFSHPEGYVKVGAPSGSPAAYNSISYVYQYKDHLGNVRLSYTKGSDSTILSQTYNNTTGGWAPVSGGSLTPTATGLKINSTNTYNGAQKILGTNIGAGVKMKVTINSGPKTTNKVRVMAVERDGTNSNSQFLGYLPANTTAIYEFVSIGEYANLYILLDRDPDNVSGPTYWTVAGLQVSKATTRIIQENNYYPFGMAHMSYNGVVNLGTEGNAKAQKYQYNGKELQDEMDLNMYDFGFRNYDPALGRWMNIDPLAETSRRYSPYAYAMDNPVYYIDPDGMKAEGSSDDLTLDDFDDDMIDTGYRKIPFKKFNGAVNYSGPPRQLNEKGQQKIDNMQQKAIAEETEKEIERRDTEIGLDQEVPKHQPKPLPNPKNMDPRYRVGNLKWKQINGRWTIVNSKGEILQWDSKKGEVELYSKDKEHKGGYSPDDRNKQISKPVKSRTPNGGKEKKSWKFFRTPSVPIFLDYFLEGYLGPEYNEESRMT